MHNFILVSIFLFAIPKIADADGHCFQNVCIVRGEHGCRVPLKKTFDNADECCVYGTVGTHMVGFSQKLKPLRGSTSCYHCASCETIWNTPAVDGEWSEWTEWDMCSHTCGAGLKSRTRVCDSPPPSGEGKDCKGEPAEVKSCNTDPCPVDGVWSEWSSWGTCSVTCGDGMVTRSRKCNNPAPTNGGNNCIGPSVDVKPCHIKEFCPMDGQWSPWGDWNPCTVTCGKGSQSRKRECNHPPPKYGGKMCIGNDMETKLCSDQGVCAVDGGWSDWTSWEECSRPCGNGIQTRTRQCDSPQPFGGGEDCNGIASEIKSCNINPCSVDGGWSEWSPWGMCSVTCGDGIATRKKECNNPAPMYGGKNCIGSSTDFKTCSVTEFCPIDGQWSSWADWGPCPVTCGKGSQSRKRMCNYPPPTFGGKKCIGDDTEMKQCSDLDICSVDGGWSDWTAWGKCSSFCGNGTQTRTRKCDSPPPFGGGKYCNGNSTEVKSCNNKPCSVDGHWSDWSPWGACSVTCGDGIAIQTRKCNNPAPMFGGKNCIGTSTNFKTCSIEEFCPIDGQWSEWEDWNSCSVTCGKGIQSRKRKCNHPPPTYGGKMCFGNNTETKQCSDQDICSVDGGWSDWTFWEPCSRTCGNGIQSRSRECSNPRPFGGGKNCSGMPIEIKSCSSNICPVDGNWSEWSSWGKCSITCGDGIATRSRKCNNPAPMFGGKNCVGTSTDYKTCSIAEFCPIDGQWSSWADWNPCSVTCGKGSQFRKRKCNYPPPTYGGKMCIGNDTDTKQCSDKAICSVDGGWSDWTSWGNCSRSCDNGTQTRTRKCDSPRPLGEGKYCDGNSTEIKSCNTNPCPVDGKWSEWLPWDTCSVTCGEGIATRNRKCNNPAPMFGGKNCTGQSRDVKNCLITICPIDGQWSSWADWNVCSVTCGKGIHTRKRKCDHPPPAFNGKKCIGDDSETKPCQQAICSVDGGWSNWTSWEPCSRTCGHGIQKRTRNCDNPLPFGAGKYCEGDSTETKSCNTVYCPVDGAWSEWSFWGTCSVTCGDGVAVRTRKCDNPPPMFHGKNCTGPSKETKQCSIKEFCPIDGQWSPWTDWGSCSVTCGNGTHSRKRICNHPKPMHGGKLCIGNDTETKYCADIKICSVDGGWSDWSDWGICSRTCGGGIQTRTRQCNNPHPTGRGKYCVGNPMQSQICNTQHCPVDGKWSPWLFWSPCSVTCGKGTQVRERQCKNPPPMFNGKNCSGENIESRNCSAVEFCPVDGKWTSWTVWSLCSTTCGAGTQLRSRYCTNPAPLHGGKNCTGDNTETKPCSEIKQCSVDGNWTEWTSWGACSVTCGEGTHSRKRDCTNPAPLHGGKFCIGEAKETKNCSEVVDCTAGKWSAWSEWSSCSVTCENGESIRKRNCTSEHCIGKNTEVRKCMINAYCPVDGGWSDWGEWSLCSKTCNRGHRSRSRECNNPAPRYGGKPCPDWTTQYVYCNVFACPGSSTAVDGLL